MEYKLTFERYQQGLKEGKFLGLRCERCGVSIFPPQAICRDCGSHDLEPSEMKGKGTIRTFTVIRVPPEGMKPPYIVAMVEIDEGAWVMGRLVGVNADEADIGIIGRKVRLGNQPAEGIPSSQGDLHVLTFEMT